MIKTYNMEQTKANLSRILDEVSAGDRVIITQNGVLVAEVIQHVPAKKFVIGCLKDEFTILTPEEEAEVFAKKPYVSRLPDDIFMSSQEPDEVDWVIDAQE